MTLFDYYQLGQCDNLEYNYLINNLREITNPKENILTRWHFEIFSYIVYARFTTFSDLFYQFSITDFANFFNFKKSYVYKLNYQFLNGKLNRSVQSRFDKLVYTKNIILDRNIEIL